MPESFNVPTWAIVAFLNVCMWAFALYKVGRWVERIEQRLNSGGDLLKDWKEKAPGLLLMEARLTQLEAERATVAQIPVLQAEFKAFADRVEGDMERLSAEVKAAALAARQAVVQSLRPLADALAVRLAA